MCKRRNLSFLPGIKWKIGQRTETIFESISVCIAEWGETVNRFLRIAALVILCGTLAVAASVLAQSSGKKSSGGGSSAAVTRGKSLFQQKCAVCHYDTSNQKKIGPGLKGISKRGTFSVNGNKITDDSLKAWIENGDQLMPPFKEVLEEAQVKDVISYVKTL